MPTFYADVIDIFMSTRRARVIVDLAGPLVELFCGSLAFLAAYQTSPGVGQALLFGVGVLLWEGALINLYPFNFLELDDYNIVADLLASQPCASKPWRLRRNSTGAFCNLAR